ncbi:MAG: hypothetical protein OQJ81_04390 [Melioribacteraceae bacterium]|nr:hypothetical protein [Melioribacteraceae bacterium]
MQKILTLFLILIISCHAYAQNKENNNSFGISFKGFVKTDLIFDTRETVSVREGHFLLYPQSEKLDNLNNDINGSPSLNMLSIQSRLTGTITAPDAFGAKTSGVLEGAFFGHSNGDINGFRLRHAFIKLDWEKTTLLIGQYWNPMFITEVFPGVVSFNTGVPFQPFSRNPQIRVINKLNNITISLTAASQRDFASSGPNGASSEYLRNAVLPILDFNLQYSKENVVAGFGVNYKSLKPISEYDNYKVDARVNSYSAMAFAKFNLGEVTIKLEGVYGTNLNDVLMLGGYAIKSVEDRGELEYTSTKILSAWTDISFGPKNLFGIFAGYTKNLGTEDINSGTYYSRGTDIEMVWRISPRVQYQMGSTRFAAELEYTTAAYGISNNKGEVENSSNVSNLRSLIAAYLFF